jgi:hypothetical protein
VSSVEAKDRLKIDSRPRKLRIDSEPYVAFAFGKYCPVIDVVDLKTRIGYYIIVDPQSLGGPLRELEKLEGCLTNLIVWVNKESDDKFAKYQVALA